MTLVAYVPALQGGFIWDDDDYVTENPTLRSLDGLRRIWLEPRSVPQYYPLVHTSYWIEYRLWGLAPFGYHLVNVLLHGLGAVLLWRVLRRLRVPGAWLAAAVFALHPVHVESVAWITERKNVLSGVFYLGAALAYLKWALSEGEAKGARSGRGLYALSLGLFLCALLSKTVAATLPAALLVVLWWKRGRVTLRDALPLVPMLVAGAAAGSLTSWLERHHVGAVGPEWDLTLLERALVAGRALWFYLGKLVWPHPLLFVYPKWKPSTADPEAWALLLSALAALGALFALRGRSGRGPLAAALYFALTLLPALGFFAIYPMRFSWVADHFQYLASIGPIALAIGGAASLSRGGRVGGRAGAAACAAVLLAFGGLTWSQARLYRDEETLWRETVLRNPGAWIAHNNLGGILLERGELEAARARFEEAVRLEPRYPEAQNNLGIVLERQGRRDEAVARYRAAIEADPSFADAHNNLGVALASEGRLDEALPHLREAVLIRPWFARARYNLGLALSGRGELEAALHELEEAARLEPGDRDAHLAVGVTASRLAAARALEGRSEEARRLQVRAVTAARASGREDVVREAEEKLRLYTGPAPQ